MPTEIAMVVSWLALPWLACRGFSLFGLRLSTSAARPARIGISRWIPPAAVGVAESQLFPKFYINGAIGLDSIDSNKFFRRDAFMGSIGPAFRWPLFQGGNLVAAMKAAESKMSEAALKYELAVQTAYGEARNAYSAYTQEYHRYQSLQGAVKAAKDAVDISQNLYTNGLKDFNNVLDAQRSLLTLEEALTISRGKITTDLIALYKALGGGIALD